MEYRWVTATIDGTHIVAVQHNCGEGSAPVNCRLDEHQNWECPSCASIYGAALPLQGWAVQDGYGGGDAVEIPPEEAMQRHLEALQSVNEDMGRQIADYLATIKTLTRLATHDWL